MTEKSQEQMTYETHQALLGVKGTEDKGLVGDFKDLVKEFRSMNGRVSRNSRLIFIGVGIFIVLGAIGGLELTNVINVVGG